MLHRPRARGRRPALSASLLCVDPQGCAERSAGVTSRRLNPGLFEEAGIAQHRVHDAIERNAASHRQVTFATRMTKPRGKCKHCFLERTLQRGSKIEVLLLERRTALACRPEERHGVELCNAIAAFRPDGDQRAKRA